MLLNRDVDMHLDNSRELYMDMMSLRFEGTMIEKRSLLYSVLMCTQ